VIEEKTFQKIYSKALNFVSDIPRTRKEVLDRLDRYVFKLTLDSEDKYELKLSVLTLLEEDGLINDERYVRDFINNFKLSSKPRSIRKIKYFLFKKGITSDLIERELSLLEGSVETGNIEKELNKAVSRYSGLEGYQLRSKLTSYLLRKGYDGDMVYNVVDTFLGVK
jgi:regulatory protein